MFKLCCQCFSFPDHFFCIRETLPPLGYSLAKRRSSGIVLGRRAKKLGPRSQSFSMHDDTTGHQSSALNITTAANGNDGGKANGLFELTSSELLCDQAVSDTASCNVAAEIQSEIQSCTKE